MAMRNLKYNVSGTIDLEYQHPVYGWIPFTASPNDVDEGGRALHAVAMSGLFGAIAAYVAPPITAAQIQAQIDGLERTVMLPRPVREFLILSAQKEASALGLTEPQLYTANLAYKRVKDFDNSIVTLRQQMEVLQ
jgi:hypothetical protein